MTAAATGVPQSVRSHGDLSSLESMEGNGHKYIKGRFLGKGGFAQVYEVRRVRTGQILAAKIIAKSSIIKPRAHEKLKSEIAIHRSLDEDKIVKFLDYFEDSENVYIILELCSNQTLNEFMRKRPGKRLSEPEAMFYVYDLIVALKYLRRRRVIHRDLKLGNLFLDADARIKVGDFGLAAQLEHDSDKKRTICGTPNYIAPEILEGRNGHSYEVDIWSLGVILYTMLFGRPPFETSDVKTTYRRIRYNQYSFPDTVQVSESAKDLITCILRTDPRSRPSLDEILSSPWFKGANRFPPAIPPAVSTFAAASPRVSTANKGSETPDRMPDLARIDSPAPHRAQDRSPSTAPLAQAAHDANCAPNTTPPTRARQTLKCESGATAALPWPTLAQKGNEENMVPGNGGPQSPTGSQAPLGRAQSARLVSSGSTGRIAAQPGGTPLQPTSCPSRPAQNTPSGNGGYTSRTGPSTGAHDATPRRTPSCGLLGGRPPLAHRGNEENHMPGSSGGIHNAPIAAVVNQGSLPSYGQNGQLGSASARHSPQLGQSGARSARQDQMSCGEASPLSGSGVSSATNRAGKAIGAPGSSRSTICSPRQTALLPGGRAAPSAPSQKGARVLGSSNPEGRPYSGSLLARTTCTAVLRNGTSPPPIRDAKADKCDSFGAGGGIHSGADGASARGARFVTPRQRGLTDGLIEPVTPMPMATSGSGRLPLVAVAQSDSARGLPGLGCLGIGSTPGASSFRSLHGYTGAAGASCSPPELWVTKWVDYSSKYGVGYMLSDGTLGVYFNDSTKVILAGTKFDYITRRTLDKPEIRATHTLENYPEDLKKKVTLLRHFKNYLSSDALDKKEGATVGESGLPHEPLKQVQTSDPEQAAYVKKWTRNKHAILFQLSNKIVQVMFFDKSEAVLSSKSHMVTYVDKSGQVCEYPLSSALDVPNAGLAKRLRYTKDILVNLLGVRTSELPTVP